MSLSLVIHRPDAADAEGASPEAGGAEGMRKAVRDAIWEVADAHWAVADDSILVSTDLSPSYLVSHFQRALARRGFRRTGLLLVTTVGPKASWAGLPPDSEAWLRDMLP
ncbi:hypothetical protein G3576_09600 [Roseomonas stagni]|uniref:Uncharacterized protein n=1 Tax=Falsiroseomonas algicola TaxID=2716930 RepID=A0A6M1LJC8_9PROT|nr:hypothetical protein [Falsiroseomonas algicola]NGM20267.1 hypothetical protein [Falsiroseomonas algicola]